MNHCVASYARQAASGQTSIWSLTYQRFAGGLSDSDSDDRPAVPVTRCVTIEVRQRTVVQVRGKNNRAMNDTEEAVIRRWAERNDLAIAESASVGG